MTAPFRTPRLRIVTSATDEFRAADEAWARAVDDERAKRRRRDAAVARMAAERRQPFMRIEEARRIARETN